MKVVHAIRSDAFAGVERYVGSVAPLLAVRGVEVSVIGGETSQMTRALGPGIPHTAATTTTDVGRALVRGGIVDVVHAHMTAAETAGVLTARAHRGALVSTRHFGGRRGASLPGHVLAPFIRRRLAQQLSVSQFVANTIGEPSVVIVNGVPVRDEGTHRDRTVLVLQRLEREKQTNLALRAWKASTAKDRGWSLAIAGDGARRADLVALADELGVANSVRFIGHVADGSDRVGTAGILLAPAGAEPFGLSVVEAMAAATPVVAAAGGGHLETVGGCTTDHLFAIGNADECAARLDALVQDDAARVAYGRALQQYQRARFDVQAHVDELLGLYERLV